MNFTPSEPQARLSAHQLAHPASFGLVGMGLGKTASTLWSILTRILMGEARCTLVVAPLRVAVLTWPHEVDKWAVTRGTPVYVLRNKRAWAMLATKAPGIYCINYEALPKLVEFCKSNGWPFEDVVFDESTKAKNPQSKRINAFRPLLKHARSRWALTGTPNPESLMELYAQVRLLDDGKTFGPAFEPFKRRYFHPIDYMEYDWRPNEGAKEAIYARMAELAIVLRSEDWLDIPDTVTEDIECHMPEPAQKIYAQMEKDLIAQVRKDKEIVALSAGVQVNKLLQITGGAIYDEDKNVNYLHDAKLSALSSLRKRHAGEPILVACNYRHEQDRVNQLHGAIRFDSARSDNAQRELVERWNSGGIPLLCADYRSVGHGLNLQAGGRVVVWFSPTYSREGYEQFNARLARRGQERTPLVYRLTVPGTIDDAVYAAQEEKGAEQSALLEAVKNLIALRA